MSYLARRALLALARPEPIALLATGLGLGLLARAALDGAGAIRSRRDSNGVQRRGRPRDDVSDTEVVAAVVETVVVRVTRLVGR